MAKPLWATPERQAHLAQLHSVYGNRCLQGHLLCRDMTHYVESVPHLLAYPVMAVKKCMDRDYNPILDKDGQPLYTTAYSAGHAIACDARPNTLYTKVIDEIAEDWRKDDLDARAYQKRLDDIAMHKLPERGRLRGHFNAISRTIFADNQPMFEVIGLGVSGLTYQAFVKVRVASSVIALHVDITEAVKVLSRNKRKKVLRYGQPLPATIMEIVSAEASKAIADYLA